MSKARQWLNERVKIVDVNEGITRRNFAKGAAFGAIGASMGGLLAGCGPTQQTTSNGPGVLNGAEVTWDKETDIVVVGAGGAGAAAIYTAREAGAEVILVDKMTEIGGSTVLNDGIFGGHEDRMSKELGLAVTTEDVYEWFLVAPNIMGPRDNDILRIVAEQSSETIDWLLDLGVVFKDEVADDPLYTPLPVLHRVEGGGKNMKEPLEQFFANSGAEILMNTRAMRLITNPEGRVIGITAEAESGTINIKAKQAVILTTGGYTVNEDMVGIYNFSAKGLVPTCAPSCTGDGIIMATELGAITARTGFTPYIGGPSDAMTNAMFEYQAVFEGGIVVDENAKRFLNEDLTYNDGKLTAALLPQIDKQEKPYVWAIMLESEVVHYSEEAHGTQFDSADTIEELAAKVELDPAALRQTVDAYNSYCAAQNDPDFGSEYLIALDHGPYYGLRIHCSAYLTTGGLKTDTGAHVLAFNGVGEGDSTIRTIPGLYAAGEVCEVNSAPGWGLNSMMVMARIAGTNAAGENPVA
ncbi:MAG: FAD-dependent oxidoreductase [Coriobacteriales bacterium]|nr:FAD-dependent oxidoreductase [Coriobacteriales bacterium]